MKSVASEHGGHTYIGLSGTSHPLSSEQKKTHAEALFHHPVMTGDQHSKNLFSFLSHVNKKHDEVHLVAGSDRAPEYEKTMREWNGRKDSKGNVPFHFKKWKVHQVEGERMDSPKHPTQMNRNELEKTVSATKVEGLAHKGDYPGFKAYHPDMPEEHVKKVYNQIRSAGPKPVATVKAKLKEQINQYNEELNHKHFGPMLDSFVSFASDKLGLKSMPNIQLQRKDEHGDQPSFGGYNPGTNCIVVITKDRHPMDIFRTVAHELVHQKQKQEDRIGKNIEQEGATGSDIENEANAEAGKLMRWYAKANPDHFKLSHMTEETLNEGIFDPATHTAVFLAGGPGSGKDFVMSRTLHGHGLTEINSDNALEHLMNKQGLDMKMPENQKAERDLARGRAKNIAREQQRLALAGRKGVIINGTGDDPEKIATIKGQLENLGYKTMMMYVHTTDKVSRERNNLRGIMGGRTVPEKIRSEKWHASKKAMPKYKKMFGDENLIHVDNSDDYNLLPPEQKAAKDNEHNEIFKRVRQFTSTPVETPQAKAWEVSELSRRGIQKFNRTKPITFSARLQQMQEEAKKMKGPDPCWKGYQMVGKKKKNGREVPNCVPVEEEKQGHALVVNNKIVARDAKHRLVSLAKEKHGGLKNNEVFLAYTGKSVGDKWKNDIKEETPNQHKHGGVDKDFEDFFMGESKPSDREWGTKSLTTIYKKGTPGQYTIKQEEILPPSPGNVYGPTAGLGPDSIGPTAPTATMAAGGGVTGGGYSIPMYNIMNESVKRWLDNPKTQERFRAKYGNLAEQKLSEMAQKINKLPHTTNIKPKHITEFVNGDVTLAGDGISKGKDTAFDNYGTYSGRGGVSGDREVMGEEGPGQKKLRQALEKMQKGKPDPEETKKKMVADMQKLDPQYKAPMKEDALEVMPPRYRQRLKDVNRYPGELSNVIRSRKQKAHVSKEYHSHPKVGGGKEPRATRHMEESTPAWQRKEGKNPEGGLNKAGIASYRREHPGSKLSLAVTTKPSKLKKGSKKAKRRLSFCRRMKGMKAKLTSAKTARDPDSRINKSLRKWNCEE